MQWTVSKKIWKKRNIGNVVDRVQKDLEEKKYRICSGRVQRDLKEQK